jgi:hypothetical protein
VDGESGDPFDSTSEDGDEGEDEESDRGGERGREDDEDEKEVADTQESVTTKETGEQGNIVKKSPGICEKDEVEEDDSESVETRYPDDNLLEPFELTETEQRDVAKYIPWEYDAENPAEITQIKNRVMAMLIRCREGLLTEFRCCLLLSFYCVSVCCSNFKTNAISSWNLGICCPAAVLGDGGILPRRQKNIETIRIINDSRCYGHDYWLTDFPKLNRLTWIPLTWRADLDALAMGLEKFAHQLTLLELDIFEYERKGNEGYRPYYAKSQEERNRPNYFAWDILGLSLNEKRCMFRSLERLYLCGVPFYMAGMEMAHAFNWSRLRSLHLRFCRGWEGFLQQVIQSGQKINLESLTLEPSPTLEFPGEEVETICSFLNSFSGLRELFLSTNEEHGTLDIWRAALNHKATLRIFVHNQRIPAGFWGPVWDGSAEPPHLPFASDEFEMMRTDLANNPLSHLDLEFLGLTVLPGDLVSCLRTIAVSLFYFLCPAYETYFAGSHTEFKIREHSSDATIGVPIIRLHHETHPATPAHPTGRRLQQPIR